MLDTFLNNTELMTKRSNLLEWEFNLKTISNENFQALVKARQDYVDIQPLLVMPENDNFLILGGNSRNKADTQLNTEDAWIKVVEFGLNPADNRWYVLNADKSFRADKRSFATKEEAMHAYSLLHNAQWGGVDPDKLSQWIGSPLMPEFNWDDWNVAVGSPQSLKDFQERVAAGAEEAKKEMSGNSETHETPTPESPESPDVPGPAPEQEKQDSAKDPEGYIEVQTKCSDCGNTFFVKVAKNLLDNQPDVAV